MNELEERGEGGVDTHGGYDDDAMTVLQAALDDEESLRDAIADIDVDDFRGGSRQQRAVTALPMPPAPVPSTVTEDELREDEEARWMGAQGCSGFGWVSGCEG